MKCKDIDPNINLGPCRFEHPRSAVTYKISEVSISDGGDYFHLARTFLGRKGNILKFTTSSGEEINLVLPEKFKKNDVDAYFVIGRKYKFNFN